MSFSASASLPVLAVDDEAFALAGFEARLNSLGIEDILLCTDGRNVESILREREIGVMLLDLSMPEISGEDILALAVRDYPEMPVLMVTGANDLETAVRCMQHGAFDYLVKPVEERRFASAVLRALEVRELRRDIALVSEKLVSNRIEYPEAFAAIVTQNAAMFRVFQLVEMVAHSPRPVLVTGETGTGKELIARAVHRLSGRTGAFVAVNVGGVDDTVFSDTLFGHVKGAFTGAEGRRLGLIETAAKGTLFLDEIGELAMASQVKLLRLIQEQEYFALGSDVAKKTDARIVVATNRNIKALSRSAEFRKDLYFRLTSHQVHLPPLRERKDDLPLLTDHFLEKSAQTLGKTKPTPPPELFTLLHTYDFPGNVRELESMIFDAVSRHTAKKLSMETFLLHIGAPEAPGGGECAGETDDEAGVVFPERLPTMEQVCDALVREAMKRAEGNQSISARLLGISRTTLNKRLKRIGG